MDWEYGNSFNPLETLERDLYGKHKINRFEKLALIQHLIAAKSLERAIFLINKYLEHCKPGDQGTDSDYKKALLFNKYLAYRKLIELNRIEVTAQEVNWKSKLFYEDLIQIGFGKPKNKCIKELSSDRQIHKIFFSLAGKEELGVYSDGCHLKTFTKENKIRLIKDQNYYQINDSSQLYLVRFDNRNGNGEINPEQICRELKPLLGEFINMQQHNSPIWLVLPLLGKDILYDNQQKEMARRTLEAVIDLILFNELRGLNRNLKIIIDTEDQNEFCIFNDILFDIKKGFTCNFSLLHEMFYYGQNYSGPKQSPHLQRTDEISAKNDNWDLEILGFKTKITSVKSATKRIGKNLLNDEPILLLGDTGVGKTFIAKKIAELREKGGNKGKFVHLNCAGIPSTLMESEIFGYKKGSHNLAPEDKKGKIAAAEGGILFLDEIGNASIDLQEKLLTFLDDKKYYPLGALEPTEAHVKIIFATNKDIEEEVSSGRFREDFYYRISKLKIRIPSLCERKDELGEIINKSVKEICINKGIPILEIDEKVIKMLTEFPWPGNYRQLLFLLDQYIEEASEAGLETISEQVYNRYPPELLAVSLDGSLQSLGKSLKELVFLWPEIVSKLERLISIPEEEEKPQNPFNLIDAFIKPVLRNIYIENEDRVKKEIASKRDISKLIGFVPTDQNKAYRRYDKIYKVLKRTIK